MSQKFPIPIKELQHSLRLRAGDWENAKTSATSDGAATRPRTGPQYLTYAQTGAGGQADLDYSKFVAAMSNILGQPPNRTMHQPRTNKAIGAKDIVAADYERAAAMFAQRARPSEPLAAGPPTRSWPPSCWTGSRLTSRPPIRRRDQGSRSAAGRLAGRRRPAAAPRRRRVGPGRLSGSRTDYTGVLDRHPALAAA